MTKTNKKLILFLGIIFTLFSKAGFAFALENVYPSILGVSISNSSTFEEFVCYFFGLGINLAILIAVIIIAFGSIYFLIDYGRGKFVDEGKAWIKAGILGLLIVICSYTIAYTINPKLNDCKVGFLALLNFNPPNPISPTPPGSIVNTYNEIPIGTLTETLLTRTMDCYGFDQEGNPVDGEKTTDGKYPPTYLNHDRADCLLQLADGAQKKGHLITSVSNDITNLMNLCNCYGKCDPVCDRATGCKLQNTACPGGSCTQDCVKKPCKIPEPPPDPKDCCPKDALDLKTCTNMTDFSYGCQLLLNPKETVKEQIEHGPISVFVDVNGGIGGACKTQYRDYAGLDEFRSAKSYSDIKTEVEDTITIYGRQVTIIKTGNCGVCTNNCKDCTSLMAIPPLYAVCMVEKTKCEKDFADCQTAQNNCQQGSPWYKLKLIDQMTYYKGKIDEIKQKIKNDENVLQTAKTKLDSPQCYLATTYIDLLNAYKITKQPEEINLTKKIFKDPETGNDVSVAKYCNGFNYNNSSCLKKCNDLCPDTSSQAIQKYGACSATTCTDTCEDCSIYSAIINPTLYTACMATRTTCENALVDCRAKQTSCIDKAYKERPCGNASGSSIPKDFNECITSCQSSCSDVCVKKYLNCSAEYTFCKKLCDDNSQCVLGDTSNCLFGANNFIDCASQLTDQGNTDYCINKAYTCKNGSDEYAGYPDCAQGKARPPAIITAIRNVSKSIFPPIVSSFIDWLTVPTIDCSQGYSSSFLFEHPECEKCLQPYEKPDSGSVCYNSSDAVINGTPCMQLCPEVSKCPTSSKCPYCSCDRINQAINFFIPNTSTMGNAGNAGYSTVEKNVSGYELVGPQCNGYSYNDDPLTFYCQVNWWENPNREGLSETSMGTQKICPSSQEIPVGQTVDDAKKWADFIVTIATNISNNIGAMISDMKKAGDAILPSKIEKDYCFCIAKMATTGKPICTTDCIYHQVYYPPVTAADGSVIPGGWNCWCQFQPCTGRPCQQVVDYLSALWNDYGRLKTNHMNFYTTMLTEPRSDVMKELSYSRKTTNSCSLKSNAYGTQDRLLSCTRVKDESISPIDTEQIKIGTETKIGYCYGKELGNILTTYQDLTDNWFCCQEWSKSQTPSGNQIYNIQQ